MAGYLIPSLVLKQLAARRKTQIRESLPDALDLMVVCVEAGQGLNAAIKRVGDDLRLTNPILSQEMLQVNLEISAGVEREQALRNLGERTGVDEVISLCNILIQSDRFGTSVANTLKIQSDACAPPGVKNWRNWPPRPRLNWSFPCCCSSFRPSWWSSWDRRRFASPRPC